MKEKMELATDLDFLEYARDEQKDFSLVFTDLFCNIIILIYVHNHENSLNDAPIDVSVFLVLGGILTGVIFYMFKHYLDLQLFGKLGLVLANFLRMLFFMLALFKFYDEKQVANRYQMWLLVTFNASIFGCFDILKKFMKYEVDYKNDILKHQKEELEKEKARILEAEAQAQEQLKAQQ